jgi:DNA-directed RNA polymerase subunit F
LENLENERDIDELLRTINKEDFFEFQNEEYLTLFKEISDIDVDNVRKKILDFLTTSNEEIKNIFETKKKVYKAQLQNEIFKKLYNKTSLEEKIDKLYSEGINMVILLLIYILIRQI